MERENILAKFWLTPVRLASSGDFGRAEINRVQRIVAQHQEKFQEAWHEFFGD